MGSKWHSIHNSSDEGRNSSGGDLAYHGPRIYEAKVQKTEFRKKEWKYFVHYLGWNKRQILCSFNFCSTEVTKPCCLECQKLEKYLLRIGYRANSWDEWVGADRLLKHTEENILKQQALEKKQGVDKHTKSGRSGHAKPKSSAEANAEKEDTKTHVSRGSKRKSDSVIEKDNASVIKLIKIQMPSSLRKRLIDDWESVTKHNKLIKLPRSPTVDEILTKYHEDMSKNDPVNAGAVAEILTGVRCYFDKALALMLLYKKEYLQYNEAVAENVSPSTVYGAEHLLRLFDFFRNTKAHSSCPIMRTPKVHEEAARPKKPEHL